MYHPLYFACSHEGVWGAPTCKPRGATDVLSWSAPRVAQWLCSVVPVHSEQLTERIICKHEIDGQALMLLSGLDLVQCGAISACTCSIASRWLRKLKYGVVV